MSVNSLSASALHIRLDLTLAVTLASTTFFAKKILLSETAIMIVDMRTSEAQEITIGTLILMIDCWRFNCINSVRVKFCFRASLAQEWYAHIKVKEREFSWAPRHNRLQIDALHKSTTSRGRGSEAHAQLDLSCRTGQYAGTHIQGWTSFLLPNPEYALSAVMPQPCGLSCTYLFLDSYRSSR